MTNKPSAERVPTAELAARVRSRADRLDRAYQEFGHECGCDALAGTDDLRALADRAEELEGDNDRLRAACGSRQLEKAKRERAEAENARLREEVERNGTLLGSLFYVRDCARSQRNEADKNDVTYAIALETVVALVESLCEKQVEPKFTYYTGLRQAIEIVKEESNCECAMLELRDGHCDRCQIIAKLEAKIDT